MFNSQRGISYTPSGRNSKEQYLRRQAEAAKQIDQAYREHIPAQVIRARLEGVKAA